MKRLAGTKTYISQANLTSEENYTKAITGVSPKIP